MNFHLAVVLWACLCAACSRPMPEPVAEPVKPAEPTEPAEPVKPAEPVYPAADKLFALVKPGENPIWFEFGAEGPVHIASPDAAALTPYEPWTCARFAAGMSMGRDRLVMAVNRYGFLVWVKPGEAPAYAGEALYALPENAWDTLTVAALFRYRPLGGARDAVLLYRDNVFADGGNEPPLERVRALPSGGFEAEDTDIPAFAPLPRQELWDLESLRQGHDGAWYFRGARGGAAVAYYRAAELSSPGSSVAVGVFRSAASPYTYHEAPPVLRIVLEAAAVLEGGKALVATIVSPEYDAPRYFSAGTAGGSFTELAGFYLPSGSPGEVFAAAVFPDGRLVYAAGEGRALVSALPALPEGFVYTRLGAMPTRDADMTLFAAWEEQQDWNIGAAGFMVITLPRP